MVARNTSPERGCALGGSLEMVVARRKTSKRDYALGGLLEAVATK